MSKKEILHRTMSAKDTPLSILPDMGPSLKIFAQEMALLAYVFNFTHNAVNLWSFRCVYPEIRLILFDFDIKKSLTNNLQRK